MKEEEFSLALITSTPLSFVFQLCKKLLVAIIAWLHRYFQALCISEALLYCESQQKALQPDTSGCATLSCFTFTLLIHDSNTLASWGSAQSEAFGMSNGIKHGFIICPCLFNMYVEELNLLLPDYSLGCHTGCDTVNGLSYADDLAIAAATARALNVMLVFYANFP